MNEYINLTLENIDEEHICCAIGDKKHQAGVDSKKEWIKSKLKDGHIFRKLNTRGKIFIEYEPIETAWIPISGKNYEYIYCLWVAGSFKGKGIGKELLEYAINDSKEKGKSGICTLVSKKKKPFIGEKKFFEHYGFKVVDIIGDYELLALQFDDSETPRFNDNARTMKIDNQDFTIYYSNECPYVEYEVNELTEYAKENNIQISETEKNSVKLLHGKIGADIAKKKYGVSEEIAKAIEYHTTTNPNMDTLAKIIYVSDKIELNRKTEKYDIEAERKLAKEDLDKAMLLIINDVTKYLIEQGKLIAIESIETRNKLLLNIKGEN